MLILFSGCESRVDTDRNSTTAVVEDNKSNLSSGDKEDGKGKQVVDSGLEFLVETINSESLHIKEIENGMLFQEFKDRPILLIFFGYKCPPCLREIPRLNALLSKHQ